MKYSKWMMIGALSIGLFSCSDNADKDDNNVPDVVQNLQMGDELHTQEWGSECRNFDWIIGTYQKTIYDFDGGGFEHRVNFYEDENCENIAGEIEFQGGFVLNEVEGEEYHKINFDYDSAKVELQSEVGVKLANTLSFCGISDWEEGREFDVTKAKRDENCPLFDTPGSYYDIVQIFEEDGADRLYFGSGFLGPAAEEAERDEDYTELNENIEYRAE